MSNSSINNPGFDVFMAHNSADKEEVILVTRALRRRKLKPWLDDEQIRPGTPFQDSLKIAIPQVRSTAIFIGLKGYGKWQIEEIRACITQSVKRSIVVIPVLLPGLKDFPDYFKEDVFLAERRAVIFKDGISDRKALDDLKWGITGQARTSLYKSINNTKIMMGLEGSNLEESIESLTSKKSGYDLIVSQNAKEIAEITPLLDKYLGIQLRESIDWLTSQETLAAEAIENILVEFPEWANDLKLQPIDMKRFHWEIEQYIEILIASLRFTSEEALAIHLDESVITQTISEPAIYQKIIDYIKQKFSSNVHESIGKIFRDNAERLKRSW